MLGSRALAMSNGSDNSLLRRWGEYRRPPRRSLPRWTWSLLAVATVAALGLVFWLFGRSGPWRSPSDQPAFASCTYGGYVNGWCAYLRVAEDPRKPNGPMISLRIAVLPATKRPAAGALFYLEGGPGGAATAAAIRVNAFLAQVQQNRDLVMVDQRGTGGSRPLACPKGYVRGTDATAVTGYLRRCLARLDADSRLYTTSVAADDLEIVRRTLGYGRIDLFGGSYGATLAQAYVRRYPESVRSVVLDSASLPDVRIYDVSARNAERALEAQLARCAAAPACARAYPHPRRQLDQLLARPPRLAALPTGKVLLRPDDIAWTVDWLSETAEDAAIIPFAVNAAARGDYTTLATTYADGSAARTSKRSRGSSLSGRSSAPSRGRLSTQRRPRALGGGATSPRRRLLVPGSSAAPASLSRRDASQPTPAALESWPCRRCCLPAAPTHSTPQQTCAAGVGSSHAAT